MHPLPDDFDLNAINPVTTLPYWFEVLRRPPKLLQLMFDHGADINTLWHNKDGLQFLLSGQKQSISQIKKKVRILLDHGIDVNRRTESVSFVSSLSLSFMWPRKITSMLIMAGADVTRALPDYLESVYKGGITDACALKTVQQMIYHGADVNYVANKMSPLAIAIANSLYDFRIPRMLLQAGANPNGEFYDVNMNHTPWRIIFNNTIIDDAIIDRAYGLSRHSNKSIQLLLQYGAHMTQRMIDRPNGYISDIILAEQLSQEFITTSTDDMRTDVMRRLSDNVVSLICGFVTYSEHILYPDLIIDVTAYMIRETAINQKC